MKKMMIPAIALVAMSLLTFGIAKTPPESPAPDLTALDKDAVASAANSIVADHRALEQTLTTQLDSPKTTADQKVWLIYTLGQLRSTWAVASLVRIVDFPAPFRQGPADDSGWGPYPVVDALTSIGSPAVFHIVQALAIEKNPLRVQLMVTVILGAEGAKPGQAWLEKGLAEADNDEAKQNLKGALAAYQALISQLNK